MNLPFSFWKWQKKITKGEKLMEWWYYYFFCLGRLCDMVIRVRNEHFMVWRKLRWWWFGLNVFGNWIEWNVWLWWWGYSNWREYREHYCVDDDYECFCIVFIFYFKINKINFGFGNLNLNSYIYL